MTFSAKPLPYSQDRALSASESHNALHRLERFCCIVAVLAGFLQFWSSRYLMYSDGISYLDIADLYAHGPWRLAVNEYWSPMFSWILAAALSVLRPAASLEVVVFHGVLLAGYLTAIFSFRYFLCELRYTMRSLHASDTASLPFERSFLVAAYATFVWGSMPLIALCTPDVLVAALVYLVSAMLISSARRSVTLRFCCGMGVILGLCWLTKAAMLPVGVATLAVFFLLVRRRQKPVIPLLATVLAMVAVSLPFMTAIRVVKGHWGFGKAGVLNYSWEVGGVTRSYHWQGGPDGFGAPVHPTRRLTERPPVYEFSNTLPVTYAPWFDPPYWYEGLRMHFDVGRQWKALITNTALALLIIATVPGLIPAIILSLLCRPDRKRLMMWWSMTAGVWVWCLLTVGLYCLVFVEPRYIGAPLAVAGCVMAAFALVETPGLPRFTGKCFAALSALTFLYSCWRPLFFGAAFLLVSLAGMEPYGNACWREAQYLSSLGMKAGDRVGVIGIGVNAYWARLLHTHVIAETPALAEKMFEFSHASHPGMTFINEFWRLPAERQKQVLDTFAQAGVQWVVAEPVPPGITAPSGWITVPFTRKGEQEYGWVMRTFVRRIAP